MKNDSVDATEVLKAVSVGTSTPREVEQQDAVVEYHPLAGAGHAEVVVHHGVQGSDARQQGQPAAVNQHASVGLQPTAPMAGSVRAQPEVDFSEGWGTTKNVGPAARRRGTADRRGERRAHQQRLVALAYRVKASVWLVGSAATGWPEAVVY